MVDSATRAPLPGALVAAVRATGGVAATVLTDGRGRFLLDGLVPGTYRLTVSRLGYAPRTVAGVLPADSGTALQIALAPRGVALDPVQISASRIPETALDAPVSVSVITRRDIAQATAFTPLDHVRAVPGMDFAAKGLLQNSFAVRGGRGPASGALLMMVDYRNAALPSIGVNFAHLIALTNDDLEQIEVVRGPGAALYGPDAHRGVVHLVTRSPFESRGAALSLAAGDRSVLQAAGRFAAAPSARFAFKVSGEYLQGRDWPLPANLETLRRDTEVRHAAGELRVDWLLDSVTTVVASLGAAQAINVLETTGAGDRAWQLLDWRYSFAQARLHRRRLFANVTYNLSNAGHSYMLHNSRPIVDNSRFAAGQVQHESDAGRFALLYGVDGRWTDPRTGGTIHGRNEDDDLVAELGGFVQARTAVSPRIDLVTAVRADRNNRLDDVSVSPRAGVIFTPAPAHALRLTYNVAFSNPDPNQLFADLVMGPLPGAAVYTIRRSGIPRTGFSFRRGCAGVGGLCMRSPFDTAGYLAADATLLWDSVAAIAGLSGIRAPNSAEVGTLLREWNNATKKFEPASAEIADFEPLRRSFTQTLEIGYKGVFGDHISVMADGYVSRVRDPVAGRATPNVFLDSTTLVTYLRNFLAPDSAVRYASALTRIPVGTISPQETSYPFDVLLLQRQSGAYTVWGADVGITAAVTSRLEVAGTYSWLNRNVFTDVGVIDTLPLTIPRNKAAVTVRYRHEGIGLTASMLGRAVGEFLTRLSPEPTIDAYTALDVQLVYEPPWMRRMNVVVAGYNVLDNRHREIAGGAELGRLVVTKVQARF